MKEILNCPNCGAPVSGSKCEYCDTVFEKTDEIQQVLSINYDKERITLFLYGEPIECYVVQCETEYHRIYDDWHRSPYIKRSFRIELVEV